MHKFNPANAGILIGNDRREQMNPVRFLSSAGLSKGMTMADIGCGPGFFTIPAAGIVGDYGRIYAIDMQKEMLSILKQSNPPSNVTIVSSLESSIPLGAGSCHFALAAFVLHEVECRDVFLSEIRRLLIKGGRLLLLEWKKQEEEHGPSISDRISCKEAEGLVKVAGFEGSESKSINPSHYFIRGIN